jgi:filamentous hemagglutinin family protein
MAPRGRLGRLGALAAALLAGTASGATRADVATDGTLGRKVKLTGRNVEVGADLGRIRGKNLFHSFERFGVPTKSKVTFTGPGGLDNVVSRVTGGEPSSIDGTLASRVPGADVYLVNPSGIVFGPDARLDVPGSFHASTADELRFGDGVAFSASNPGRGGLSVASPEAFGFLSGGTPGAVTVDRAILKVADEKALSLVGGDIEIAGDGEGLTFYHTGVNEPGFVQAKAGRVALVAMGGPGAVRAATGAASGAVTGRVRLAGGALVDTSGDGGGAALIRGGAVVMDLAFVFADNEGASDPTGGVTIEAGTVRIDSGSRASTDSLAAGDGGRLTVRAGELAIIGGSTIGSNTYGPGDAGPVSLAADSVLIAGPETSNPIAISGVQAVVTADASGDAALITVEAGRVELVDGGQIFGGTFGAGDGGAIAVVADVLVMRGDNGRVDDNLFFSGLFVSTVPGSSGDAGTISVEAGWVQLLDGGGIFSSAIGTGNGGTVTVRADDLQLRDGGAISSDTFARGDAGEVRVEAERLLVSRDGAAFFTGISSDAVQRSTGDAGTVTVVAGELEIRDGGEVGSSGLGAGRAGDVRLGAGTLRVEDARVRTVGTGAEGGRVEVAADDLVLLRDAEVTSSGIEPRAGASLIALQAPLVVLLDGSRVTSLTGAGAPLGGSGEARLLGDLTFISGDSEVLGSSTVELAGVDNNVGTGLQVSPGAFLDAGALLGQTCAARRAGEASTLARAGRGGLPPSPDRPLSSGGAKEQGRAASAESRRLLVAGTALSAECDGRPLAGAM